jgi:hypothetical protein
MNLGITGISDLSQNKYAAVMKELANGLAAWSGIFLLFFFVYQIATNESVSLFSWKSLLLIIVGETAFVFAVRVVNIVYAAIVALLFTPLAMKGKIALAQNIQMSLLAVLGLFLCVAAWFFAEFGFNYVYS